MGLDRDQPLFDRLLSEGEGTWLEFKTSWFDPGGIGRYASALANTARLEGRAAGYLVWGVDDKGQVVGTDLDLRKKVVQRQPYEFWLHGRLTPRDHRFEFKVGEKAGKRLFAMSVEATDRVPVRFEGIPYIRVGPATPALADYPDHERRLLAALAATDYESDRAREHAAAEQVFELLDVEGALTHLPNSRHCGPRPTEATRELRANRASRQEAMGDYQRSGNSLRS